VAFSFTFSELEDGRQTATAYYATGSEAQTREPRGDILIEAAEVIFMTHGRANPQDVRPHDDLLAHFPYLGPPNP